MPAVNSLVTRMGLHDRIHQSASKQQPHSCSNEQKYYVADATRARILVILYGTLIESLPDFRNFDHPRKCPMLKCFKRFTSAMELIEHLFSCTSLAYGEMECWDCDGWHSFPVDEKGWAAKLDPKKKSKSVIKTTSQLFRRLSAKRDSRHKERREIAYPDEFPAFTVSETHILDTENAFLPRDISVSTPADLPPYGFYSLRKIDSMAVEELPAMEQLPELPVTSSDSKRTYVTAAPPVPSNRNDDECSNLLSQTYVVSPRSTIGTEAPSPPTKGLSLDIPNDSMFDSPMCASPDALQPGIDDETPPWVLGTITNHQDHTPAQRSWSGSTLETSSIKFDYALPLSANFASSPPSSQSPRHPRRRPKQWNSVSSSGGSEESVNLSRDGYSPCIPELEGAPEFVAPSSLCLGAVKSQHIAELDSSSVNVAPPRQKPDQDGVPKSLVCKDCGYRPSGLERNRKNHFRRHMNTHKNETFPCDICGQLYNRVDNMKKHRKERHPEIVDPSQTSKRYAERSDGDDAPEVRPKRYRGEQPDLDVLNFSYRQPEPCFIP